MRWLLSVMIVCGSLVLMGEDCGNSSGGDGGSAGDPGTGGDVGMGGTPGSGGSGGTKSMGVPVADITLTGRPLAEWPLQRPRRPDP